MKIEDLIESYQFIYHFYHLIIGLSAVINARFKTGHKFIIKHCSYDKHWP